MLVTRNELPQDDSGRFAAYTTFIKTGTSSHKTVAQVRAGETARVQVGGIGREIRGRLEVEDGRLVDWTGQLISASFHTRIELPHNRPPIDPHDFVGRLRLLDFFDESEEWRDIDRTRLGFHLQVAADGFFTIEDVPPGAYQISAMIRDSVSTEKDQTKFQSKVFRFAKEVVLVPNEASGFTPIELGTLRLQPNPFWTACGSS